MRVVDVGVTLNYEDLRKLKTADAPAKVKFVDDLVSQLELVWKPRPCKRAEVDTGLCSLTKQSCPSITDSADFGIVWCPKVENQCPSYEESKEDVQQVDWDEISKEDSTETQDEHEDIEVEEVVSEAEVDEPVEERREIEVDGQTAVLEVSDGEKEGVLGKVRRSKRASSVSTKGGKRKFNVVGGDERCAPDGKPEGAVARRKLGKPSKTIRIGG